MNEVVIRIRNHQVQNGGEVVKGFLLTATFDDGQDRRAQYEHGEFHDALGKVNLDQFFDRSFVAYMKAKKS